MAIQTSDLLLRLSPTGYLSGGRPDRQDKSVERDRLRLMREQFENTKQQQAQAMELSRLEEGGRMARAQLQHGQQMAALDAEQAAAVKAQKLDAYKKFTELNGSGDVEGARTMLPFMTSLGMGVDLEGEENGLPRYRISMDPEAEAEQETNQRFQAAKAGDEMGAAGIGYDTANEAGDVSAPVGIASSDEVNPEGLSVAERVASTYGDPGEKTPMIAPTEPDYTGGVPKNVLDMGAINSAAAARLNPALSGLIAGLPEQYQASARSTASGIGGLGIPAAKAVEMFGKQQGDANALITGELSREQQREQAEREQTKVVATDRKAAQQMIGQGTKFARDIGKEFDIKGALGRRKQLSEATEIIGNEDPTDDYLVGATVTRMLGDKGATTENDIKRALGNSASSFLDRVKNTLYHEAFGGLSPTQRNAIAGVLKKAQEEDQRTAFDYMTNLDEQIGSADTDPDVARGMRSYRDATLPREWRTQYDEAKRLEREKSDQGSTSLRTTEKPNADLATMDDFDIELEGQALENGLDPAAIRRIIQRESGGKATALNASGATGLIQFMPETAKGLGTTTEEIAKMTAAEQLPLVMRYFANAGLDETSAPDDYAVAVAAPSFVGEPDDTVVYPKSDDPKSPWAQNRPWRPPSGGDITVGSIKAAYRSKRVRELLKKKAGN